MNSNDRDNESLSWWVGPNFSAHLPIAQARMRLETPSAPVLSYLKEVESAEKRESLGLPRFKSAPVPARILS